MGNTYWLGFDNMNGRMLAGSGVDPLPQGLVPPKSTIRIAQRPQIAYFRGERLFVHRPNAESFLIHEVHVGYRATTAASNAPIPADAFVTRMDRLAEIQKAFERDKCVVIHVAKTGAELLGTEWCLPICNCGTEIKFTVENIGCQPFRFIAGFLGEGPEH